MRPEAQAILDLLVQVDRERERRQRNPELQRAVTAVKEYQQLRFKQTYADLLQTKRYGAASRFFLEELYGPRDFSRRDEQFKRVVPGLVLLFPKELVETVDTLARLHAVSELMDSEMGARLAQARVDASAYIRAWQATGQPQQRADQIELTLEVGRDLDRYTHRPLLRHSLRLMRGPARAAGIGELQHFLESGFDTFRSMNGAGEFLAIVGARERELAASLFAANPATGDAARAGVDPATAHALEQLP